MKRDNDELELLLEKLRWLKLPGMVRLAMRANLIGFRGPHRFVVP